MDTIQLKSKEDGFYMSVVDDCIMSMTSLFVPIVTVSEEQLGILGHTLLQIETLIEGYYFPRNKIYDLTAFMEERYPNLFGAIEWYGEVDDPEKDAALDDMIKRMDEESGKHD